jgi:hypothetical protein
MITFQFFDGCPNSTASLENLRVVVAQLGIDQSEIETVEIVDPETAEALNFQGSPTILKDGVDIYTGAIPSGSSYSCRVYNFDGKQTGIIPVSFLKDKLTKAE